MQEVSHLIANYSKSSQKFDVLPFYGMNLYEKLGQTPAIEVLEATDRHKKFKLWNDFKNCAEKIFNEQALHGFQLLLPSERGRVTRGGTVFACEPGTYLAIVLLSKSLHSTSMFLHSIYSIVLYLGLNGFSSAIPQSIFHPPPLKRNGKTICQN